MDTRRGSIGKRTSEGKIGVLNKNSEYPLFYITQRQVYKVVKTLSTGRYVSCLMNYGRGSR